MKKNVFKRYKNAKNIIIFSIVFICGIISLIYFQSNKKDSSDDFAVAEVTDTDKDNIKENDNITDTSAEEKVIVYVCGRVRSPGVYELKYGDRIIDAVNKAGGTLEDADLTSINMAELVEDSSKIEIYQVEAEIADNGDNTTGGTGKSSGSSTDSSGKVNINKADQTELMTLPGIGESRAGSIIAYRKEHGNFKTIEDIMNVSGIKESAFSKIKDLIKV